MSKSALVSSALILFAICVQGFPGELLSWENCVREASGNNAEFRAAQESVQASRFKERGAFSAFLPQLSASAGYDYGTAVVGAGSTIIDTGEAERSASGKYTIGLSVSQSLFSGFRDRALVRQAGADLRSAEASLRAAKAKASFDLKSAYTGLRFAQRSVTLQQKILERRQENFRLVDLRFQSGRENRGSVLLSEAYLKQARYEILQAGHAIEVSRAQLARVLGRDNPDEITVSEDIPALPVPDNPDFQALLRDSPEHLRAVAQEDSAEAALSVSRSGFFPTFNLTGNTSRSGAEWYPQNDRWSMAATLTVPLFSGGKDYYATRSSGAQLLSASATRINTDRQLLSAFKDRYAAFSEAVEKVQVDESFRSAALKRAEIARSKYNNGLMSFEDWDLIENDLIARERALLQSRRDRTLAEAAWEQALGKGVIP